MSDTINSKRYKELIMANPTSSEQDIPFLSFSMNLDGVQASKSSQNSLYPLMLVLNELPPNLRQRNIIIPFLFMKRRGSNTKFHTSYLGPFVEEMKLLGSSFSFVSRQRNCNISLPVYVYSLNCDSVMKCDLLHLKGVTGYFSCPKCKQKGESVAKGRSSTVVKPATLGPKGELIKYHPRSKENFDLSLEDGVCKKSILSSLPMFTDIFCNAAIDSMHGVYLGVFKLAAKLWFKERGRPFSVSPAGYRIANDVMQKITPSSSIVRGVRSLDERADWKASEWRSFGYFWAPLILEALVKNSAIDQVYLDNWILFTSGLSLLNSENVSPADIKAARKYLSSFCVQFTSIYGKEYAILNPHLMVHVAESVDYLGPMWSTSLFINESFNQTVLNCFRSGTGGVVQQISERFTWRKLSVDLHSWLKQTNLNYQNPIAEECWKLGEFAEIQECSQPSSRKINSIDQVGRYCLESTRLLLPDAEHEPIFFDRIKKSGMLFTTRNYHFKKKLKNRDSFFYSTKGSIFGDITEIVRIGNNYFVLYNVFKTNDEQLSVVNKLNYAHFGEFGDSCDILPLRDVTKKCTMLQFSFGCCLMYDMNNKEGS